MSIVRVKTSRKETDYTEIASIQKTFYDDGIDVTLRDNNGRVIRKVEMPRDGKTIYIMNELGDTTDAIHWPVKPIKPATPTTKSDNDDDTSQMPMLRV